MPLHRLGGLLLLCGHPPASPSALRPGDETASESLTLHAHSTTDVSCIYRRHDARVTRCSNHPFHRAAAGDIIFFDVLSLKIIRLPIVSSHLSDLIFAYLFDSPSHCDRP